MENACMKCWVVLIDYDYEGRDIEAIFDSKKDAEAFADYKKKEVNRHRIVEEWDIKDKFDPEQEEY